MLVDMPNANNAARNDRHHRELQAEASTHAAAALRTSALLGIEDEPSHSHHGFGLADCGDCGHFIDDGEDYCADCIEAAALRGGM